jgi:hypothetical protein
MARPAVELAFTDRAGVHWLRSGDGTLTKLLDQQLSTTEWVSPGLARAVRGPVARATGQFGRPSGRPTRTLRSALFRRRRSPY